MTGDMRMSSPLGDRGGAAISMITDDGYRQVVRFALPARGTCPVVAIGAGRLTVRADGEVQGIPVAAGLIAADAEAILSAGVLEISLPRASVGNTSG